ncbi:MAG: epoxyqueuosine reductase QueH [Candidatus Latescibacteria bacterium]|nr:epoxyqueuosine reductase QueH [Candidatus Latescibacterota bacterium]
MPKLLLHICCGPCATTVIERLIDGYDITGYFYNPNIQPGEEYERRLYAARAAADRFGVRFVDGIYDPEAFFSAVKGLENEPENGLRCAVCYRLRLTATAEYAAQHSFEFIASTLTVGPQKKAAVINPIGSEAAEAAGVTFIDGDWKKKDGFRRSVELSREMSIYRQHYCGCIFSIRND